MGCVCCAGNDLVIFFEKHRVPKVTENRFSGAAEFWGVEMGGVWLLGHRWVFVHIFVIVLQLPQVSKHPNKRTIDLQIKNRVFPQRLRHLNPLVPCVLIALVLFVP